MNNAFFLFEELKKFEKNFIERIAGEDAGFLQNFLYSMDLTHDEFSLLLNEDHKRLLELLQISKYSYDNNLNLALDFLSTKIKNYNFKFEKTSIPNHSQKYARFSKNKNNIRLSKNKWKFSSKKFIDQVFKIWNDVPSSHDFFIKNNTNRLVEIDSIRKKELRYEELRCKEFAESARSIIKTLCGQECKGYRQISLLVSACILAKVNKIDRNDQKYSPVIYPFFEFQEIASPCTIQAIEQAENSGHSYFDHHLIMIPSFLDYEKTEDLKILKNTKSVSFVLGEKDGSCYFICEWKQL